MTLDSLSKPNYKSKIMTKQKIFDVVYLGLASQKFRKALRGRGEYAQCVYRSANGRKCAAGWLIPDSQYKKIMDDDFQDYSEENGSIPIGSLIDRDYCPKILKKLNEDQFLFLQELQGAHDNTTTPKEMRHELQELAEVNGLKIPIAAKA